MKLKLFKKGKNKKGFEISMLLWWLIALAVAVAVIISYIYLRTSGSGLISLIKNFLRFG